jgi:hypothetical protein
MPLNLENLLGDDSISVEPGEVQKALSWATHITPEQVDKIHKKLTEITAAEDRAKAIQDNSLFFLQIAKAIFGGP